MSFGALSKPAKIALARGSAALKTLICSGEGGILPEEFEDNRVDQVRFSLSENVLYKNLLTVLDLLGTNNWERPIYYSTTVSTENYLNLQDYFIREGLALRIAPARFSNSAGSRPWKLPSGT